MSEEAGPKGSDAWSLEQSGLRGWGERSGPQPGVSALWAGRGFRKLRAEVGRAPSGRSAFVGSLSGESLWARRREAQLISVLFLLGASPPPQAPDAGPWWSQEQGDPCQVCPALSVRS